jgi:hypothetical protein
MHPNMPTMIERVLIGVAVLVGASGCTVRYTPPTLDEPHAIVKLRRVYNDRPGPHLREVVQINGEHAALEHITEPDAAPNTEVVLVRPGATSWLFTSTFFHYESRSVQESYTVYEHRTSMQSYSCGSYGAPRTCTRSVSQSHPVTKYRWVTKRVPVADDTCSRGLSHQPELGHVYLLQLTYQGSGVCQLTCFEQEEGSTGMTQRACAVAVAP